MNIKAISRTVSIVALVAVIAIAGIAAGVYFLYYNPAPAAGTLMKFAHMNGWTQPGLVELATTCREALNLYADLKINSKGGLLGMNVTFVEGDTQGSPEKTLAVFENLKLDKDIVAFLGPSLSTEALGAYDRVKADGRPWFPIVWSDKLRMEHMNNLFFVSPWFSMMSEKQAEFIIAKGFKSVVFLVDDDAAAVGSMDTLIPLLEAGNVTVQKTYVVDRAATDFTQYLLQIKQTLPAIDLFIGNGIVPNYWILLKQGNEIGLFGQGTGVPFYDLGWNTQSGDYWAGCGNAGIGVLTANTYHAATKLSALGDELTAAYVAKTGKNIEPTAYEIWDAFISVTEAIRIAGTTEKGAVCKALQENSFVGTRGILTYKPDLTLQSLNHQQTPLPLYISQWVTPNLDFTHTVIVWPREVSTGDMIYP